MGSHDPFGHLKYKLWPKEGLGVELAIWLPTIKSRELPDSFRASGVQHTIGKLLTRVTTLLWTSSQLEVCRKNYGPPKLRESQVWEFRASHLGVLGKIAIWMMVPWLVTKYTIKGKVVASPMSRLRWILWVRICLWLVLTPKVLKLCTNQLVVWFVQVRVSNWCFSLFLVPISEL
jgi:hypothetical protein